MADQRTYYPNGIRVGTVLDVEAEEMSIGENGELTISHDGTDGEIKADNVAPSDLHIVTGTEKTMVFDDTIWEELPPIPVSAARLGATAPTLATFIDDIQQYTFNTSGQYIIGAIELIHKYKEGSDLRPHIHWSNDGSDIDDRTVKWQMKYTIANVDNEPPFDSAFPSQVVLTAEQIIPGGLPDRTQLAVEFPDIPGTGLRIGAHLIFRFERIASSGIEPTNDPFALSVGVHFEADTVGSRQVFIK